MPESVIAEVVRSGFVESVHYGSVLATRPDQDPVVWAGDPAAAVFPRSVNKPLQAIAMMRAGLDLPEELLAVSASSHSGEPRHIDLVRRVLAQGGLDESALRNTAALPLDQSAALAWVRAGGGRERILQNCSGKHAAMVVTCVRNGWPLDDYRHPAHPLQRLVASTLEEFTGEKVAAVGVDGCGAPLFAASLVGLARAFCRLLTAPEGSPERSIADAMRRNPEVVGGTGRDVTRLMQGIPGLLAKDGAEGTYVAALADGAAVVVKVGDGADRARMPVMVTALRALGVDAPVLDELATVPVLGGGAPVGVVRSVEL